MSQEEEIKTFITKPTSSLTHPGGRTTSPGSGAGSPSARRHSAARTSCTVSVARFPPLDDHLLLRMLLFVVVVVCVCCLLHARPLPGDRLAPTEDDVSRPICRPAALGGRGRGCVTCACASASACLLSLPSPSSSGRRSARRAAVRTPHSPAPLVSGVDGERGGRRERTSTQITRCPRQHLMALVSTLLVFECLP